MPSAHLCAVSETNLARISGLGGGEIIASFLDEQAIDEFVISVAPVFIGESIPLTRRPRHLRLELLSIERFEDGLVQLHYRVQNAQS